MAEGIMTLWFVLTGLSLAFVAIDIRTTPEATVLKWAFVILVAFTGPFGAFFYVLGCREPLPGTHEQYVAARWRQVLGSTMHCAAGDGLGIVAGAVIGAFLHVSAATDFMLEYGLGFGFGWAYFQAFAMRDMAGGSYLRSLQSTFLPELLSMNLLMAGMEPTMRLLMGSLEGAGDPLNQAFWFVMSMSLIVGFILAYPMNWWLVVKGMKHGMLTVRKEEATEDRAPGEPITDPRSAHGAGGHADHVAAMNPPSRAAIVGMTIVSFVCLAIGVALAFGLRGYMNV